MKVANPETGRHNILRYKWQERDRIANCMLLTAEENGAGGKRDIPPEIWFKDKCDRYLEMHLIPKDPELWTLDNFEAFIKTRETLIFEKFQHMIQATE